MRSGLKIQTDVIFESNGSYVCCVLSMRVPVITFSSRRRVRHGPPIRLQQYPRRTKTLICTHHVSRPFTHFPSPASSDRLYPDHAASILVRPLAHPPDPTDTMKTDQPTANDEDEDDDDKNRDRGDETEGNKKENDSKRGRD